MIIKIQPDIIPFSPLIRSLCSVPYRGNSRGCPNLISRKSMGIFNCPPRPLLPDFFDLEKDLYLIYTGFCVGSFAEEKRLQYPKKQAVYPDASLKGQRRVEEIETLIKEKHPDWPRAYFPKKFREAWVSSRTWYQIRWWQGRARAERNQEIKKFQADHPEMYVDCSPEATGVNVTGLMHNIGITLNWQWPPPHDLYNARYLKNTTFCVALAGHLRPELKDKK